MNISEKLDLLMNLTNTKNTSLSKALSFDPSYISRIRSGSRGVPKNQPFTRPVAAYFAKHLKEDYQLDTISQLIPGGGSLPNDKKDLEEVLFQWLENDSAPKGENEPINQLLSDITLILDTKNQAPATNLPEFDVSEFDMTDNHIVPVSVYYGNQGKRESVRRFLSSLLSTKKTYRLCLFSDEDMSWLTENPEFARDWAIMLMQLMKSGSSIQIIHTISRDLSELMEAIRKWIPLYSTGAIEPYYCPRLRDGIYRRSIFVAKGHSALVSTSVENHTEDMANFLIKNSSVVSALEKEFDNYFALCKPLMRMYTPASGDNFFDAIKRIDMQSGQYYMSQPAPSLWTTPEETVDEFVNRTGNYALGIKFKHIHDHLIGILQKGGKVTELLYLPPANSIKSYDAMIPMSDMLGDSSLKYNYKMYLAHLKAMQALTEEYPNYEVLLTESVPTTMLLLSHSEFDTIIASANAPTVAFVISHQQFSYAFYEYLERAERENFKKKNLTLADYIKNIENS